MLSSLGTLGAQMKKLIFVLALALAACGGGGSDDQYDAKNLADGRALHELYELMASNKDKRQFETSNEYDARLAGFAASLNGYYADFADKVSYDADRRELLIRGPYSSYGETYDDTKDNLRPFHTRIVIRNYNDLYQPQARQETRNGQTETAYYYRIIPMEPAEAQRIINGFRFTYSYVFTAANVKEAEFTSCSAPQNRCDYLIAGNVQSFRYYNTVDGKNY